jgi:ClpP class serine protease
MPNWGEVFEEIGEIVNQGRLAVDIVRKKYLEKLYEYTGRNVIAYYSGWLQKPGIEGSEINDDDMNGFMRSVHKIDCSLGLDLVLYTPGGGIAATESIINYLHKKFDNNIRIIVPQIAMSAGTMMACSGRTILMGKQSSLGPITLNYLVCLLMAL